MLLHGRQPPPVSDEDIPRHDSAPHGLSLSHRLSTLTRGLSSSSSTARLSGLFRSQRVMPLVRQSHDAPSPTVLDTQVKPLRRELTLRDRVTQLKLHRKKRQSFERRGWKSTSGLLDTPKQSKRAKSAIIHMPTFNLGRRQSLIRRTEEMQAHQEMISVFNLRQTKRPSFHRSMSQRAQINIHRWFFQTIHPNSILLKLWHTVIIVVIVYQALYVPFAIGFDPDLHDTIWMYINYAMDAVFLLDIGVNMNIAFYEYDSKDEQRTLTLKYSSNIAAKDKYLVRDRKKILLHYAKGWLGLDTIAAIPIDWFEALAHVNTTTQEFALFKAVRIPRVFSIFRLLKVLKTDSQLWWWLEYSKTSIILRLSRLILYVIYNAHFCTCIWYSLASSPGGWGSINFHPDDLFYTYVRCFYVMLAALMGQDIFPIYTSEMIYLAFASIVGSVTIATVFGDVSNLVSSLYADSTKYREKMEEVYESMQHLGLPHEVQQRVHLYYTYLWQQYHTLDGRSAPFVSELSTNLQREIMLYLNAKMIRNVPLMQECSPEVVQEIVLQLETRIYMPEDFIINIGEIGFEMFFVQRGECEVLIESPENANDKQVIKLITVGDYFGEIALLMDCRRTACVRAKTFCVLCVLHRSGFRQVIARHKDDKQKLESLIMEKYKNDEYKPKMPSKLPPHRTTNIGIVRPSPTTHAHTRDHPRTHGMGVDKTALKMLWDATSCLHDVTSRVAKMEKSIDKLTKAVRQMRVPQQGHHHHTTTHHRPSMNLPRRPSMQRRSSMQSDASFVLDSEALNHAHHQLDGSIHLHKRRYSFLNPDAHPKHNLISNDTIDDEEPFEVPKDLGRRLTAPNARFDTFDDDETLQEQILQNLDDVEQELMSGLDDIAEEKDISQRKRSKKSSS